jgi:hypothetical protein
MVTGFVVPTVTVVTAGFRDPIVTRYCEPADHWMVALDSGGIVTLDTGTPLSNSVPLGGVIVTAAYPVPAVTAAHTPAVPAGRGIVQADDACTTVRVFIVSAEPGHVVATRALSCEGAFVASAAPARACSTPTAASAYASVANFVSALSGVCVVAAVPFGRAGVPARFAAVPVVF